MHHKNILLVSATTRLHERMRELSHVIDVSIALANAASFSQAAASGHTFDLIILDQKDLSQDVISTVENYSAQNGGIARLFVADLDNLSKFVLPVQGKSDFILSTATIQEFSLRCSLLLWPGTESTSRDLVIVDNRENRDKSNTYPLSKNIRERQIGFWKLLRDKGFISKEKYFRLTRNTPFSDAEKAEFIARQLVETRQSTKAVAEILKRVLPKSIIVYVKAGLTSRFRQYGEFIKVRDLNDYHHAKDAYLNIVTGNVHYTKFTSNPIRFVKDCQIYSLNEHALYKYTVERNGVVAWAPNEEGMMPSVTRWMNKNNILVTRMSYVGQGELFDQLPLKKGKGQVSLKKEGAISDISKYGGYNSASTAYFMYVEGEDNKGKPVYVIETMPLHLAARLTTLEEKQKYCEELWMSTGGKLKNPKVLIEQIPIQSLFNVDGFRVTIAGKTGSNMVVD